MRRGSTWADLGIHQMLLQRRLGPVAAAVKVAHVRIEHHGDALGLRLAGGRDDVDDGGKRAAGERQPLAHHRLDERRGVFGLEVARMHLEVERRDDLFDLILVAVVDDGVVDGPDVLEHKLDEHGLERAPLLLLLLLAEHALGLGVKVEVAPQHLAQLVLLDAHLLGVEHGEALQTERPVVHGRGKDDVALGRVKVDVFVVPLLAVVVVVVVVGCIVAGGCGDQVVLGLLARGDALLALLVPALVVVHASRGEEGSDHGVDLLDDLDEMVVGFIRRELEFCDEAIHLVEHEDGLETVLPCLAQHGDCLCTHPLHDVDDEQRTVAEPRGGGYLGREVDVAGRVDEVDHEVLDRRQVVGIPALGWVVHAHLDRERDGRCLHGDASFLLILSGVEVADLARHARRDDVVCRQQRVGKRRLAVVDMADQGAAAHIVRAESLAVRRHVERRRGRGCDCRGWLARAFAVMSRRFDGKIGCGGL